VITLPRNLSDIAGVGRFLELADYAVSVEDRPDRLVAAVGQRGREQPRQRLLLGGFQAAHRQAPADAPCQNRTKRRGIGRIAPGEAFASIERRQPGLELLVAERCDEGACGCFNFDGVVGEGPIGDVALRRFVVRKRRAGSDGEQADDDDDISVHE
jgi:hypothetical protein